MRTTRVLLLSMLSLIGSCGNCDDSEPLVDAGVDTSVPAEDVAISDTSGEDAGAPDADVTGCPPPPMQIAGTPETDPLAAAAARCGQPPHAWIVDESIGDITGWGESALMPAVTLGALAATGGFAVPRPPEHDVVVTPFTYLTQDRGELIEATALLVVPSGFEPGTEHDIVLFLHGVVGLADSCAPSADLLGRARPAIMASYGHVVVAPDYLGLKSMGEPSAEPHPFLSPQPTVISSLDAVRAVMKAAPDERGDLCVSNRVAIWGSSQGGHAALWTQRLAPYYARELDVVGGVAAVAPIDVLALAYSVLSAEIKDPGTFILAAALTGAAPRHGVSIEQLLEPPFDATAPPALTGACGFDALEPMRAATQMSELFTPLLLDPVAAGTLAELDPWGCILSEMSVNRSSIPRLDTPNEGPLLVLHGESDLVIETPVHQEPFDELCAQGANLEYFECAGEDHLSVGLTTFPKVLDYIEARLAGEPIEARCVRGPAQPCSP